MMNTRLSRERGFTLVELLVAIVSMVVILGAATGLVVTAIARHKVAFDASQLEATHAALAQAIFYAIKTADSFQIFDDASSVDFSSIRSYGIGSSSGDYLSCRHSLNDGGGAGELVEQDYEFVRTSTDGSGTLVRTIRFPSSGRREIRREFAGVIAARPFFSMRNGIPQAHWSIATSLDRADFDVYAMPLSMQ
jgi:type II secretory pathway pseudopilin PulG